MYIHRVLLLWNDSVMPVSILLSVQVMLAKNIDVSKALVNGARGVVQKFDSASRGILQAQ